MTGATIIFSMGDIGIECTQGKLAGAGGMAEAGEATLVPANTADIAARARGALEPRPICPLGAAFP